MANLMKASEISIWDFLNALASAEGLHGSVSAATVAGSIGTAVLLMVASAPNRGSISRSDQAKLVEAAAALADVQKQMLETIETETAVKIFTARNMPQASETERMERHAALQLALRAAADVPLEVMRLCRDALQYAETIARSTSRVGSADIQFASAVLQAAFDSVRANLEMKLSSLTDTQFITSVIDEIARLSDEAMSAARATESHLYVPPA